MSLSFAAGFARGVAPSLTKITEKNDLRSLRALTVQAEESYLAEKDRILNIASDEDWSADKVDQQLDALTRKTLSNPALQTDDLIYETLRKQLNVRTRAASNGYRNKYEGKVEDVREAEYALELTRGFQDISDRARGGAPAGEFSGGFVSTPFSVTPEELMAEYSAYFASTLEDLSQDKSLEGRAKLAKRQLTGQKAIKTIHDGYKRDYNKYQNDRLDALIDQNLNNSRRAVEDALRNVQAHLSMPVDEDDEAARAAMDPRSIVAALNYENISALAARRGKTYFDVADQTDLQNTLGGLLAIRFLNEYTQEEADTNSVTWASWVRELENNQNDKELSAVFSDIFGDETALFVKTNTPEIVSAARTAVNIQRPTRAIAQQIYERTETNAAETTNALLEGFRSTSLLDDTAIFRQTFNAAFDPGVGDDGGMYWRDVLDTQMQKLTGQGFFGPQTEFGDQEVYNETTAENVRRVYDYVGDRVQRTLNVLNQPGYATENLATLTEPEDRNIILRDVVRQVAPEFNDQNNYFVQDDKLSDTARNALTGFARTRGFVPPAFIDFVEREIENYEQQELAGEFRGDAQETADKARLNPVRMQLNSILNSKIFVVLPINQRKDLNKLKRVLDEIRDPRASEAPRPNSARGE